MRKLLILFGVIMLIFGVVIYTLTNVSFDYAFVPEAEDVRKSEKKSKIASVSNGGEMGTSEQIELGRKLFYEETFGNEVFFSDILGMFNGALTLGNIGKAILKLNGESTNNLQVEAYKDFSAGDFHIKKGDLIDTGLDVAKGAKTPVGIKVVFDEGRLKAGVSCAACHATVDAKGKIMEGVPNTDLQIGLALAMGTNTASYFTHTELEDIKDYISQSSTQIETSTGGKEFLPDIEKFEKFVDAEIIKWPAGSNDTTIDLHNNPVQIPDAMTNGDRPFGWSGQGQIGPFNGISAAINNAHSQNMDAVSASEISKYTMKIDKEVYLGTVLQNASNPKYRYDGKSSQKPSDFFAKVDPTPGVPGVNRLTKSPTYPKTSYMTSVGVLSSSPGYKIYEQLNAMSAYMNSLSPVPSGLQKDNEKAEEGERVFTKAGCISCHAGAFATSNKLIPLEELKTNGSRAKGFSPLKDYHDVPKVYEEGTPVPLPENPKVNVIKTTPEQEQLLQLAWGFSNTKGAYKTISLYNLSRSAPYLHDGGVAVGPNGEVGVTETILQGKLPDPYHSLKAMVDSRLREIVIESNATNKSLFSANVTGEGHSFWVDETTGFSKSEQDALIHYLLTLTD
ncbi:Predicted thiol oxidoreductase [Mycobacteroides abscessus subsp. abscessus]|nr:Predicted thiol oxidoreductase [Mycobacteroides abscessus subsp. abscessus]